MDAIDLQWTGQRPWRPKPGSAMPQDLQRMTKAQLVAVVRRLQADADKEVDLRRLNEELYVYQEETLTQNRQLIEARKSLTESRDRYMDLYHFAPVAFATLDRNGVIEEINQTGLALLGLEGASSYNRPLVVFVAKPDRQLFLDHMTRCRSSEEGAVITELQIQRHDGAVLPVQIASRPATRHKLGGFCYLTAMTDLSEQKAAETERQHLLVRQQAAQASSEAKDRFLAVLSHELRTPLTPILAAVSSLGRHETLPESVRSALEMIQRNVQLEAHLIDDLLDVTRIMRNKMRFTFQAVDVHRIVDQALEMAASDIEARQLTVRMDLRAPEHIVWADVGRLHQVLRNLLTNAIKFTPEGGGIILRTRLVPPVAGIRVAEMDGSPPPEMRGTLVIQVEDSGIGIEPEMRARLFRPFEQAAQLEELRAGLGLGLAICRGLVESHGGHITAQSPGRGKGSVFTVELAAIAAPPAALPPPAPVASAGPAQGNRQGQPLPAPLRILLVEDHPDTARVMTQLLTAEGHHVAVAHTVESALREAGKPLDLIISDLGLPDGSGLDLMRRIGPARPAHCIALSGFGTDQDIARSKEAGFDEHLTKPIDFSRLLAAIARLAHAPAI